MKFRTPPPSRGTAAWGQVQSGGTNGWGYGVHSHSLLTPMGSADIFVVVSHIIHNVQAKHFISYADYMHYDRDEMQYNADYMHDDAEYMHYDTEYMHDDASILCRISKLPLR